MNLDSRADYLRVMIGAQSRGVIELVHTEQAKFTQQHDELSAVPKYNLMAREVHFSECLIDCGLITASDKPTERIKQLPDRLIKKLGIKCQILPEFLSDEILDRIAKTEEALKILEKCAVFGAEMGRTTFGVPVI